MARGNTSETAQAVQARKRGLTPEEWHDRKVTIMEMAWDSGIPYTDIARRFRVSVDTVSHLARFGPGVTRTRAIKMPAFKELTPEERTRHAYNAALINVAKRHGKTPAQWLALKEEVTRRALTGESLRKLGAEYGVHWRSIHDWKKAAKKRGVL